jgi:hypothetical protein
MFPLSPVIRGLHRLFAGGATVLGGTAATGEVARTVDEHHVREGLWKVAKLALSLDVVLFR